MKKIFIPTAILTLSLLTLSTQTYALEVSPETSSTAVPAGAVQKTRDSIKNKVFGEKERLQTINKEVVARTQDFKQNLAKIKSAPIGEKKTFIVGAYTDAYNFLTKTHDQFVTALDAAAAKGIDVSAARAHFATAWDTLQVANTDLQSLTKIDVQTATKDQFKIAAKKVEQDYTTVRKEMRAGAESLKASLKTYQETKKSTDSQE